METGDKAVGTPARLREGDNGEVSCRVRSTGRPVPDHGKGQELLLGEALHIQMTPLEEHFNWDGGLELPGCWISQLSKN